MNDLDIDADSERIGGIRRPRRAIEAARELIGLATMVCFDGEVDEQEFAALVQWRLIHADLCGFWPLDRFAALVDDILADGVVTPAELQSMYRLLNELKVTLDTRGQAAGSIFDDGADVIVFRASVVVTGKLQFGLRKDFHAEWVDAGGLIQKAVRRGTTYLVVGDLGSDNWRTSRYGRKIETAVNYQKVGEPILIIREEMAREALLRGK